MATSTREIQSDSQKPISDSPAEENIESTPAATRVRELPHPDSLSEADIVVFDGKCRFCRRQVERLQKWDSGNRLSFVSLHDPYVAEHFPDLSYEMLMKEIFVVDRKTGDSFGGAKALRYLSRRLPRLWCLAPFLHIPFSLPLWNSIYQFLARRRYQISQRMADAEDRCSDDQCAIHFGESKKDA